MKVAGIIAEYNPLHNGHVFHIQKTRELTGCRYVVLALSGDFVQRGEPAVADKFTRTAWALEAGADLVLELPAVYAVSSAERFAFGGVRTLAATGVLSHLSFGSEQADTALLYEATKALSHEPPNFKQRLQQHLALGKSYPRARYDALEACGAPQWLLEVLRSPNSILALEYMKYLDRFAPNAQAVAVPRQGAMHDAPGINGNFSSASAIREALQQQDSTCYDSLPIYVAGRYALGQRQPISLADAAPLILYSLLSKSPEELKQIPDVQEGLENVIYRSVRQCESFEDFLSVFKSKRYTLARCKRIAVNALIGASRGLLQAAMQPEGCGYLRVLGLRKEARPLLSAITRNGEFPLIMRKADTEQLPRRAKEILELDLRSHDVYRILSGGVAVTRDFQTPPIVL